MEARAEDVKPGGRWQRIRQLTLVAVVVLFLGLLAYGLISKAPNTSIDESLAQQHPIRAPGFALPVLTQGDLGPRLSAKIDPALRDGQLSLTELRGTPVVLNFWASWCVPCREEAPILERAWPDARSQGVLFLGLNMQDLTTDARAFIRGYHNSYPNVRDQGDDVAHNWGVTGVPETFFITARSKVVGHVIGVVDPTDLSQGIAAARSGRVVGTLVGGEKRATR
jgi:cytochrome c biogenesis protein CcmG/thiol:disulfide interchange protein DsbE